MSKPDAEIPPHVKRLFSRLPFLQPLVRWLLFVGRCDTSNSYYFDAHGDTPGLRPVTGGHHWMRSRTFPLRDYRFEGSDVAGG
jgi:hypothetical protein